jgi:hypothetical protein
MNKFASSTRVPAWRILLYALLAAMGLCVVAVYSGEHLDNRHFILARVVAAGIAGFSFLFLWILRSGWVFRHLRLLFVIYLVGQTILIVWTILERRH